MASIETEMTVTLPWDELYSLTDWMRHIEACLYEAHYGAGVRYLDHLQAAQALTNQLVARVETNLVEEKKDV